MNVWFVSEQCLD